MRKPAKTLEARMAEILAVINPSFKREYRFSRDAIGNPSKGIRVALDRAGLKDWRFDFAYPQYMIAVEVEGGVFSKGRHTRGVGYSNDREKYNHAQLLCWKVYGFTVIQMDDAYEFLLKAIPK